jgi:hypothetical protein
VTLKTYNGFDHDQRMKGYRWLQREYAAGRRAHPTVCDACGQADGPIDAHSESYAEPFGDHIGRFGLCYRCHMAIHTRFNNPEAWEAYSTMWRSAGSSTRSARTSAGSPRRTCGTGSRTCRSNKAPCACAHSWTS